MQQILEYRFSYVYYKYLNSFFYKWKIWLSKGNIRLNNVQEVINMCG